MVRKLKDENDYFLIDTLPLGTMTDGTIAARVYEWLL